MIPSITYNGSELKVNEEIPRNLTDIPPPGAPELAWIFAPISLPLIAPSKVTGRVVPLRSSLDKRATDVAAFERLMLEAKPVTTTSSRRAALSLSAILRGPEVEVAATSVDA